MERERRPPSGSRRASASPTAPPQRVTRSAARRSAGAPTDADNPPPPPAPHPNAPSLPTSRKRKAPPRGASPEQLPETPDTPQPRTSRTKRSRVDPEPPPADPRARNKKSNLDMSAAPGPSGQPQEDKPADERQPAPSRRGRGGRRPAVQVDRTARQSGSRITARAADASAAGSSSRRGSRKAAARPDEDVDMDDASDSHGNGPDGSEEHHLTDDSNDDGPSGHFSMHDDDDDMDEDDYGGRFARELLGRGGGAGFSAALRAFGAYTAGSHNRLKQQLEQLKSKDPSVQLIGLQALSETLLMANEDTLAGNFHPEPYVKELVALLNPPESGVENPEMMLLACRCLAHMMEASPTATAAVVYGGAVPVLCARLLEINYIDLAEQCLSTLEKISGEFPTAIVREGGLTACLTFLDFFATSTQRTAVTTAANCCRNIPEDSFPTVRDVMPILNNILGNNDQKVVEQGCICVSRIVQSFRYKESKLEELVSADLLRAILRLLLPGTTNLIGPNIHTMLLQVLAYTAKASPRLSAELFKMDIVDTLYQILTGVSPPDGTDDVATKIDSVVIMQALIHRPKDQVFETLNVICELLPDVSPEGLHFVDALQDAGYPGDSYPPLSEPDRKPLNATRVKLLGECEKEVRRFAVILLPTLTDAYSSTVNMKVRQKVLTAQLKMLSNLDADILEEALRPVPYASHLASIFSQEDHASLVTYALQAAEILLLRLEPIYRYQFYREGVIAEISRLASRPLKAVATSPKAPKTTSAPAEAQERVDDTSSEEGHDGEGEHHEAEIEVMSQDDGEHDDEMHDLRPYHEDSNDDSDDSSAYGGYVLQPPPDIDDVITIRAKKFIELYEEHSPKLLRDKAGKIMEDLKDLAHQIKTSALQQSAGNVNQLFNRLAAYFDGDALEGITSYELMGSGIVGALLEVFSSPPPHTKGVDPRSAFLESFMGATARSRSKTTGSTSPATPFSVLVSKLQDLLSRAEHFEVYTVHQPSYDGRGSASSVLAKQLRLRLVADEQTAPEMPKSLRDMFISIHAVATFKALDEWLRSKFGSEPPRPSRTRESMAAYAAALAGGGSPRPPAPRTPTDSTNRPTSKKPSKSKSSSASNGAQAGPSTTNQQNPRRSSRRQQAQPPPPPPPPPPEQGPSTSDQEPVECPDEERLSDHDSMNEGDPTDHLVDELEEEMQIPAPDPPAANVEVGSSGRVLARQEDGTRIATPVQGHTPSRGLPERQLPPSARSSLSQLLGSSALRQALGNGALSYSAALQTTPTDWHIEFRVKDHPIAHNATIYRAAHFSQADGADAAGRTVWTNVHTVTYKRVPGPPPVENNAVSTVKGNSATGQCEMPSSLEKNPVTSGILRLLGILHGFNSNLDDVLSDSREQIKLNVEPLSQFVNTKLTAKLNRQLEEPLIVASSCLPSWSEDLARFFPFLFPFETRHLFLRSTSFGYARSLKRFMNTQSGDPRRDRTRQDPAPLGRPQRQKVRISRQRMLDSAIKVMELYGSSPSQLEVEYFDEEGTGLGPTLEFYATVSKEFSKKTLKMWRDPDSSTSSEFAFGKHGLFPAPMSRDEAASENGTKLLQHFKTLGKFIARSMLDDRIIDVSLNPTFFRISQGNLGVAPSLGSIRTVDPQLAASLKLLRRFALAKEEVEENPSLSAAQKASAIQQLQIDGARVEDMGLDFTYPGHPIELIENGAETPVTIDNVGLYVEKVVDYTIGCGIERQISAFRDGFSQVFPYSSLKAFTPEELVTLFGKSDEDWTLATLMESIKADHGYNLDSKSVRNLLQVMSELSPTERREFLQFITGSPKLPIGGFSKLTPMFTVVCRPSEPPLTPDDYLPSVMTCQNYLKLPDYSSIGVLREKLNVAIKEGQGAFHLS
ncbi:hypothetical protein M011DRAFT_470086 [Sporormia fimetaria CBS 119925]|uniref:HECT-type E3 ubiquitin transferase n=1 Tax=Sporormia fimetaria CBS 119925 TaxID=1340428 RepID=A0A6A6V4Y1_9PLEO|nr:hypothetical protein M011DRAFT_470086 [Sporormia fimetaria CBS 119925]